MRFRFRSGTRKNCLVITTLFRNAPAPPPSRITLEFIIIIYYLIHTRARANINIVNQSFRSPSIHEYNLIYLYYVIFLSVYVKSVFDLTLYYEPRWMSVMLRSRCGRSSHQLSICHLVWRADVASAAVLGRDCRKRKQTEKHLFLVRFFFTYVYENTYVYLKTILSSLKSSPAHIRQLRRSSEALITLT